MESIQQEVQNEVCEADGLTDIELAIRETKAQRKDLDDVLQRVKEGEKSREKSIVITKIHEAIMWLGMELRRLGAKNPYPESYNPNSSVVSPTADGLKF